MADRPCLFPSDRRRCSHCLRIGAASEFLRCSRCKSYVYCNKDCQKEHWKKSHKNSCKPQAITPPTAASCMLPRKKDDDPDLDVGYKYIVLNPGLPNPSYINFLATSRGLNDDSELDALISNQDGVSNEVKETLKERYNWPGGASPNLVPGFRDEFDGRYLTCIADDNFQTSTSLMGNDAAGYILMMPLAKAKGIFVFFATDVSKREKYEDPGETILITRREVLSIANHHGICGAKNTVSERINFENISRKDALAHLKKENFVHMNDDGTI
jgi:hypothetical protein